MPGARTTARVVPVQEELMRRTLTVLAATGALLVPATAALLVPAGVASAAPTSNASCNSVHGQVAGGVFNGHGRLAGTAACRDGGDAAERPTKPGPSVEEAERRAAEKAAEKAPEKAAEDADEDDRLSSVT
jgi:hypothetical protein